MSDRNLTGPLDIFYVIGELEVGGSERHLTHIACAMREGGSKIAVYSLAGDGPLRGELERSGVEVLLPPIDSRRVQSILLGRLLRITLAALHLTIVLARRSPAIVHFFLPAAYIIGGCGAFIARINIRIMSRRSLNLYQSAFPGVRWIEKLLHRTMNVVLGNSRAVLDELRKEGISDDRLALIYNGVAAGPETSANDRVAMRSSLGIDEGALVYIIVANLIAYKGHLDLIEAFAQAAPRIGAKWRLLVVGRDDGAGSGIRSLADLRGIGDKVSLLGSRPDVAGLLATADVGMLCSHQEGFSNAVLEGMAAGLPMIVTDVGGNAEAVVDGETGVVVPPHDPHSIANAIVRLAQDPVLRTRYGSTGRKRMEEQFSLGACTSKYEALYINLMEGKMPHEIPELNSSLA